MLKACNFYHEGHQGNQVKTSKPFMRFMVNFKDSVWNLIGMKIKTKLTSKNTVLIFGMPFMFFLTRFSSIDRMTSIPNRKNAGLFSARI